MLLNECRVLAARGSVRPRKKAAKIESRGLPWASSFGTRIINILRSFTTDAEAYLPRNDRAIPNSRGASNAKALTRTPDFDRTRL